MGKNSLNLFSLKVRTEAKEEKIFTRFKDAISQRSLNYRVNSQSLTEVLNTNLSTKS